MVMIRDMAKKEIKPRGRPSQFTPEIIQVILESIGNGVNELDAVKAMDIAWGTWCDYKLTQYEKDSESTDFPAKYARAKENGFISWENKLLEIANDQTRDLQPDGKGGFKSDNTAVNRDRLRVDSMKWIMAKRLPRVYGDKIEQQITGKDGEGLQVVINVNTKQQKQIENSSRDEIEES